MRSLDFADQKSSSFCYGYQREQLSALLSWLYQSLNFFQVLTKSFKTALCDLISALTDSPIEDSTQFNSDFNAHFYNQEVLIAAR